MNPEKFPEGANPESEEAREGREKALIEEISREGGTALYTSLPQEYHPRRGAGYIDKSETKRQELLNPMFVSSILHTFDSTLGNRSHQALQEKGIREAVALTPTVRPVFEDIPGEKVERKLGGLLSKKTPTVERKQTGVRAVSTKELIKGSVTDEPACELRYLVQQKYDDGVDAWYRDYSGRGGQVFGLEVVLPQSLGQKTLAEIRSNPTFIRRLAESLAVNNLDLPQEAWENGDKHTGGHPLRPPYEIWDRLPGGSKLYIQEPDPEKKFKSEVIEIPPPKD